MLRSARSLVGFSIGAMDGDIGKVQGFYFDDQTWTVRHLVVDTGGWLSGRQVLISPMSLQATDWANERLIAALTQSQVQNSPDIDIDKPISRQREIEYYHYYSYPYYWAGPYRWGPAEYPLEWSDMPRADDVCPDEAAPGGADPHLRSIGEVTGYSIRATDGDIGHVEDFLIDDTTWAVRYMIIDTRNWLPGKKVIVSLEWIDRMSWSESIVHVNLRRERIQNSPEYDPSRSLERVDEARLHDFYNRPRYWRDWDEAA